MQRITIATVLMTVCLGLAHAAAPDTRAFKVRITLSMKAQQELLRTGEGLTVSAYWYGTPKPSHLGQADEAGQIRAASRVHEVQGKETALTLAPGKPSSPAWKWIEGPVQANVNVYSSRKRSSDNILACDFIDGDVAALRPAVTVIHCALITEQSPTRHFPG